MKKILGLDVGTNSIGWSVITLDWENQQGQILGLGSRIIPMDNDTMSKFESGKPVSKAAIRRQARTARRLLQRYKLRRGRLIAAMKILNWIPLDFPTDFEKVEKFNINEYLPFSQETVLEAKAAYGTDKISCDWIIYYLRTKALTQPVTIAEMARILYHFNQRRGFKSRREDLPQEKDVDEIRYPIKEKEIALVKVLSIRELGEERGYKLLEVHCKNDKLDFTANIRRQREPDWIGKEKEFAITKITKKDLSITYDIAIPEVNDWQNKKVAHENALIASNKTVGQYYFEHLRDDKNYRIKERIIDRKFYQDELQKIWQVQSRFNLALDDKSKLEEIATTFYRNNKAKQREIIQNDLFHLFIKDIIYYQRDLKSQKHLVAECEYEKKSYVSPISNKQQGVKVCPRSSPAFQEFRIWQTIHNLKVIKKEEIVGNKIKIDLDETEKYLTNEAKENLFKLFDERAEVSQDAILGVLGIKKTKELGFSHKLNYPENKDLKGNETKAILRKVFKKHQFVEGGDLLLNSQRLFELLWHILYSLKESEHIEKTLLRQNHLFNMPPMVISHLSKLPPFASQYSSLSSKAINKLLPFMRCGKYWDINAIGAEEKIKVEKIITGEFSEDINEKTRHEIGKKDFTCIEQFQGLPMFLAAYLVYGRHSERTNSEKFSRANQINIMNMLPYNSMRNPVVEQIIREVLQLVKAIWERYGQPDEIHIELGRELKKNNKEREEAAEANEKNRIDKERVALLLRELQQGNCKSPTDIERFQIWKENSGEEGKQLFNAIFTNKKSEFVSSYEVDKYRYWAEANCRSPYTGEIIPLSELFSPKYEIEHILPKSRFFDDSMGNKTICEAEVNKLKDNLLAMEFIENKGGQEVILSNGKKVKIFSVEEYNKHIDRTFVNKKKRFFKLSEIPEEFISRQLNDTRYITRTVAELLYPVAKDENGIIYTNGAITAELKSKWGLHKKWKEILKPRFERLEDILNNNISSDKMPIKLIDETNKNNDFHFAIDYKRIDHRHHALDALIIACTSRTHIKYLSTLNGLNKDKKEWGKYHYLLNAKKRLQGKDLGVREFEKPWPTFTQDVYTNLQALVVSYKVNNRLVTIARNKYKKYVSISEGQYELKELWQNPPKRNDKKHIAIRKLMFGQPLGKVQIITYKKAQPLQKAVKAQIDFIKKNNYLWVSPFYRIARTELRRKMDSIIIQNNYDEKRILQSLQQYPLVDIDGHPITNIDLLCFTPYTAKRVAIDASFTKDKIEKLPYAHHENNWLPKLLRSHLEDFANDPRKAFVGEGLELLYKKAPYPISKVTRTETGEKIAIGNKYFEGAKGTNIFFVIKENLQTGERSFSTPALMDCIERLSIGLPISDEEAGYRNIILSPNELVYVPDCDDDGKVIENIRAIDWEKDKKDISGKIYRMVSSTDRECYFVPHFIASLLMPYDSKLKQGELGSQNKSEKTFDGKIIIKKVCLKLTVNRLGMVTLEK